jgi:hypothetical protein
MSDSVTMPRWLDEVLTALIASNFLKRTARNGYVLARPPC